MILQTFSSKCRGENVYILGQMVELLRAESAAGVSSLVLCFRVTAMVLFLEQVAQTWKLIEGHGCQGSMFSQGACLLPLLCED